MSDSPSPPIRVFLIDYQCNLWGWEKLVQSQPTMEAVGSATTLAGALEQLSTVAADVILLDLDVDEEGALDGISALSGAGVAPKVLALTAQADKQLHFQAVSAGARGVVEKGVPAITIVTAIEKVHEGQYWLDRTTLSRVLESARSENQYPPESAQARIAALTEREREVICVSAVHPEATARSIAALLHISEHTLRNHLTAIYSKLGVSNRLELFAYVQRTGLRSFQVRDAADQKR